MLRTVLHILILFLFALASMALWLRFNEQRLIYFPERTLAATPSQHGLPYEEVWLTTDDGVRLHGWFLPSKQPSGLTLLFLHGNAGNISHRFEKYAIFNELGLDVLALDYRGYGSSGGVPDEHGTYLDAQAAYLHLLQQRGVTAQRLVVYGESLGAAVAVDLASRRPTGGVILEEGFTSAPDAAQEVYPYLPVRWLIKTRYDTLGKIGRIHAPLLILHSRDDEFFPMRHAQRLLAAAAAPKQLVELHGGHNEAFLLSEQVYRDALQHFIASLPRTP